MQLHISTEEAKKRLLPGFDVCKYTHLLYHDDLHRDVGVVRLNLEAIKAFSDTVTISQRHAIAAEQAAVVQYWGEKGFEVHHPFYWGEKTIASIDHMNYEHFKIASGFELHLKARLLSSDYILHEIDGKITDYRTLAAQQKIRPIKKHELHKICSYSFNGKHNYLPGLKESSIKFSWLTDKPAYRDALGLTDQQIDVIKDYRLLRNQLHFPGDKIETEHIKALTKPIIDFLTDFINREIVMWSNTLITKHGMIYKHLETFE